MSEFGNPQPEEVEKKLTPVEKITRNAITMHSHFDKNVWPNFKDAQILSDTGEVQATPSYHNEKHIQAVLDCVKVVFKDEKGIAALNLQKDLTVWNENNPSSQINIDELQTAFTIAFAAHDLGNITTNDEKVELDSADPSTALAYAKAYTTTSGVVEQRSAAIAKKMIKKAFQTDPETGEKLSSLVEHLVLQTVYDPKQTSSDQPFWLAVQTIDQIGQSFFSAQPRAEACAGLLNEIWINSGCDKHNPPPILLDSFIKFPERRLSAIVTNEDQRTAVLKTLQNGDFSMTMEKMMCIDEITKSLTDIQRTTSFPDDIAMLIK
jgi:hypothetical protein